MRRRGMGIVTAALVLVLTACSAKSDPNGQGTEVSLRGQGEESEETKAGEVEGCVNDVDMEELIPGQTFEVTLDGWGEVTFASFLPENWPERGFDRGNDVRFRLLQGDQVVYAFPGLTEEENCYSSEWFVEIDAVAFQDYNMDGRMDVVVLSTYEPYSGRTEDYFRRARVYFQEEGRKEFYLDHALEEWLMTQGHTDSIADVMETREEYQDYVWAMEGNAAIDIQLSVIADAYDKWAKELEYADENYKYAVVNLDMDDRLGLVVANCGGTGFYTYSNFYEVSRGCNELVEIPISYREGESQADIIQDTVTAYLELREPEAWDDAGTWHYVYRDSMKDGAAKYYETLWDLTLSDNQIKPSVLGTYTYVVDTYIQTTYQNGQGEDITEKEYDTLAENYFAGWTKEYTFSLGWQDVEELEGLSREERIEKLQKSWQKFHMMEAKDMADLRKPSQFGTWEVRDYRAGNVSALSEEQIADYIGTTLTYSADGCSCNGEAALVEDYGYEYAFYMVPYVEEQYGVFLWDWDYWGEKELIPCAFVTTLDSFFGDQFFIVNENTLWIYQKGVFFLAKRVGG